MKLRHILYSYDKLPKLLQKHIVELIYDKNGLFFEVGSPILYGFDNLPYDVCEKVFNIIEGNENRIVDISDTLFYNFEKLTPKIQEKVLEIIDSNLEIAKKLANELLANFKKLTPKIQEKVLEIIDGNEEVIINIIGDCFPGLDPFHVEISSDSLDLLPQSLKEKSFRIYIEYIDKHPYAADFISFSGAIKSIPNSLKERFVEVVVKNTGDDFRIIRNLARAIAENVVVLNAFDKLSDDTKNKFFHVLLENASQTEEISELLLELVYAFYDKLDSSLRRKLLLGLSTTRFARTFVRISFFIMSNYATLDSELFTSLIENNDLKRFLVDNRKILDSNLRNKLNIDPNLV